MVSAAAEAAWPMRLLSAGVLKSAMGRALPSKVMVRLRVSVSGLNSNSTASGGRLYAYSTSMPFAVLITGFTPGG